MIKSFANALLVLLAMAAAGLAIFVVFILWESLRQPPAYALIVEKYYVCFEKQLLYGGIFGKGPTQKLGFANDRDWCWRWQWEEIDREQFKHYATQWHDLDWTKQGDWWSYPRPDSHSHISAE